MHGKAIQQEGPAPIAPDVLRVYIAEAKRYEPYIPQDLTDYFAAVYSDMRQLEMSQDSSSHQTYTTPRTLLSLIRLSMALAKLRFDLSCLPAIPSNCTDPFPYI
jgi:DNA replication licensing factor MCM7